MASLKTKNRLLYGVGINDVERHVWTKIDDKRVCCPFYSVWQGMLMRCYAEQLHVKRPSYIGCEVVEPWKRLTIFEKWMQTQDWEGKQLDKDILLPGNKVYSSDTCVFVSSSLNCFLLDSAANRGNYPIGVYWDKDNNRYKAQCNNPFTRKQEALGRFDDPNEAYLVWKAKKHEHALTYAEQQTDPRIAEALRTRYI